MIRSVLNSRNCFGYKKPICVILPAGLKIGYLLALVVSTFVISGCGFSAEKKDSITVSNMVDLEEGSHQSETKLEENSISTSCDSEQIDISSSSEILDELETIDVLDSVVKSYSSYKVQEGAFADVVNYDYDDNGYNTVWTIKSNARGNHTVVHEYDDKSIVVKSYDRDNDEYYVLHRYDDYGNLVEEEEYGEERTRNHIYENTYDEQLGLIVNTIEYDTIGWYGEDKSTTQYENYYEYDSDNRLTLKRRDSDSESKVEYYKYDEEGKIVEQISESEDILGKNKNYTEYYYENSKLVKEILYKENDELSSKEKSAEIIYMYDDSGKLVQRDEYNSEGTIVYSELYTYKPIEVPVNRIKCFEKSLENAGVGQLSYPLWY